MKRITLTALRLQNFRGATDTTIAFDDRQTTISGDNGTGKSTLYDAFLWLLFGKDAEGRKDYELKRIEGGQKLQRTDARVEATLRVDGREVRLARAFVEDWAKPRGAAEAVFKGNHTDYYMNDTPLKMSEYDQRVSELMAPADVFRLITDVWGFPRLAWEKQRAKLFELAGAVDEEALAASVEGYADLLQRLSGKPAEDYKKELAARRRKLKKELEGISPRVDQTRRMAPKTTRTRSECTEELAFVNADLEALDKEAADFAAAERAVHEAERQRIEAIERLKTQLMQREITLRREHETAEAARGASRRELERKIEEAEASERAAERQVKDANSDVEEIGRRIQRKEDELGRLRAEWYAAQTTPPPADGVCPHCGQPLPAEQLEDARRKFAESRRRRMEEICAEGNRVKESIKETEGMLSKAEDDLETARTRSQAVHDGLEQLRSELSAMPEPAPAEPFDPKKDEEYNRIAAEIEAAWKEPAAVTDETAATNPNARVGSAIRKLGIISRRQTLTDCRDSIQAALADIDAADRAEAEVARLEEEARSLAQQLADAERDEDTLRRYTRARIEAVEQRVNSLFHGVRFQLFDYTNDGSEFECCIPLLGSDGVPYPAANTALQVWAGLDIIRVLQEHTGVSAPVFIDGAERVTAFPAMDHQTVLLKVAAGVSSLRVEPGTAGEGFAPPGGRRSPLPEGGVPSPHL